MQERYYNTYSLQGCKAKNDNKVALVVIKNARGADALKQLVKKAVAEFFFEQAAEDGEKHPSVRPFANWAVTAVHSVGAMQSEYHALRDKMKQAQNLLAAK